MICMGIDLPAIKPENTEELNIDEITEELDEVQDVILYRDGADELQSTELKPGPKLKLNKDEAWKYRKMGLKYSEIAELYKVKTKTVIEALKPYRDKEAGKDGDIEIQDKFRASIIKNKMSQIAGAITGEKIQNAKLKDLVLAYGVLFDKMRLLQDKSTANLQGLFSHVVQNVHKKREINDEKKPE